MKAAVFYQKNNLKVEERKIPEPGKGQVLVRVRACGVCGTDVHISAAVKLIETGRVDVASMVYKTAPLSELPGILESTEKRGRGKYIITM